MGSTLVSSPLLQQSDDLSLLQSLNSALNQQRNKMSTAMATGNRRKQKHSNLWMNMDDFSTLSLSQSSSSSSSPSSDMTLPTPPRSPNASMGFDETMQEYSEEEDYTEEGNGIPEPLLDDLLELWCEEADFPADGDANEEISIHNALTELGFDTLVSNDGQNDNSMSETERAETMIDHLLATCKASYLSPPPTNPSSPKMQTDNEFEETFMVSSVKSEFPESIGEEIEEEIVTDESDYQVKIEESCPESILPDDDSQEQEVLQSLIDCSDGLMNYEIDDHLLDNMDKFDEFASSYPAVVAETSANAAKSVEKLLDNLKSEPKDEPVNFEEAIEDEEYDWFGEPQSKKGRYDLDDEFLTGFPDIKQDCMWNGFLGADNNISPSVGIGSGNWKQEFTFETLFEDADKVEPGTNNSGPTTNVAAAAPIPVVTEEDLKAQAAAAAAAAEEAEKKRKLEEFKAAFDNDHCYSLSYDDRHLKDSSAKTTPRKVIQGIIVKSDTNVDKVGGTAPKKTKILVPLKDLMETLQQKSFLVSPLGPNKKIIRFTGSDSVKGVLSTASFQSAAIVAGQCSSGSRTISSVPSKPNHNVRKRPHTLKTPKIEITSAMSPMEMSPSSSPLLSSASSSMSSSSASSSCSSSSGSNSLSTNPTTKKKTKAHNNMERMRRIDLRNSFENLKKLVPPLAKIPKCSKVEILRRAEEYIKGLRNQEKRLQKEEMAVRQRNAQLRSRLENTSSSLTSSSSMLSSCN